MEGNVYRIDIPCKININNSTLVNNDSIEIIAVIEGRLKIDKEDYITELLGKVNLENSGNMNLDIPSKISILKHKVNQELLRGMLVYENSGFSTNGTIEGKLVYDSSDYKKTLLHGLINVYQEYENTLLDGKLNLVGDDNSTSIPGRIEYERDELYTGFKGRVVLKETNEYVESLLNGKLKFEENEYEKEIVSGRLVIYNQYIQTEFPCRIRVKRKDFIYSIFSRIDVVNGFDLEIPSKISVDGTTEYSTSILDGKVNLEPTSEYTKTLLEGKVNIYPHVFTYIDGIVKLDGTYTRREFGCSIDVVQEAKIEIPSKITIKERPRVNYINNLLLGRAILGYPMSYTFDSKIHVRNIDPDDNIPDLPGVAGGRIVIAVSPTWSYNPYVFKSSLITFLNRYWNIYDFNFVFGGNPRSDWDILNLCNNFKIDKKKLHQVKFSYRPSDPNFNKMNIDHFIKHMFMEYPNKDYKNILRVFLFMNQPSWYYNDPLAKIAETCKMNDISCVAINSGGEYQEINDMGKLIDRRFNILYNDKETRMQRDVYHVISKDIDPRDIVY